MRYRFSCALMVAVAMLDSCGLLAQKSALQRHEQAEGFFSTQAYVDSSKYIGGGAEYTWSPRPWIGAGGGYSASSSSQALSTTDENVGKNLNHGYGFLRGGWAFRRVGLYGVVAGGRTTTYAYVGNNSPSLYAPVFSTRAFPTLSIGGKLEIAISSRLTLNYAVYDKFQFYGDFTDYNPYAPGGSFTAHGLTEQTQEVRAGLGFHF